MHLSSDFISLAAKPNLIRKCTKSLHLTDSSITLVLFWCVAIFPVFYSNSFVWFLLLTLSLSLSLSPSPSSMYAHYSILKKWFGTWTTRKIGLRLVMETQTWSKGRVEIVFNQSRFHILLFLNHFLSVFLASLKFPLFPPSCYRSLFYLLTLSLLYFSFLNLFSRRFFFLSLSLSLRLLVLIEKLSVYCNLPV